MDIHVQDIILTRIDGIDIYLQQIESWVDSCKLITNYMDKRINLEEEYAKNLNKLASSFQNNFLLPESRSMQYIFVALLSQDSKYSEDLYKMLNSMRLDNYLQVLNNRMQEHKKQIYFLKQIFTKEQNHMIEAISYVNKTKATYHNRCLEFEKFECQIILDKPEKSINQICVSDDIKTEKKRKLKDLANKLNEAYNVYQKSIKQANTSSDMLKIVKEKVFTDAANLLQNSENILKKVTHDFFGKMEMFLSSLSSQFSILEKNSHLYEVGASYIQNIHKVVLNSATQMIHNEYFTFEPYSNDIQLQERVNRMLSSDNQNSASINYSPIVRKKRKNVGESRSLTSSPANEIATLDSMSNLSSSCDDIINIFETNNTDNKLYMGINGHNFRRLLVPNKCQQCQSNVYFHGIYCSKCNYVCHKRCLKYLKQVCQVNKNINDNNNDKIKLLRCSTNTLLPIIDPNIVIPAINACIQFIEQYGLETKGLYRTSSVKSKVNFLFNKIVGGDFNLDNEAIHTVANTLKMILRETKYLLVTDQVAKKMYQMFERNDISRLRLIEEMKLILKDLPVINFNILSTIIKHIRKVSNLNLINLMTSSNLAVVFGPTLFNANLIRLDVLTQEVLNFNQLQCKILEFLIENYEETFEERLTPLCIGIELSPFVTEIEEANLHLASNSIQRSRLVLENEIEISKDELTRSKNNERINPNSIFVSLNDINIADSDDESRTKHRKLLARTNAIGRSKIKSNVNNLKMYEGSDV